MFIMPLFFILGRRTWALWRQGKLSQVTSLRSLLRHLDSHDPKAEEESMLHHDSDEEGGRFRRPSQGGPDQKLGLKATAKLSVQFCLLWVSNWSLFWCLIVG
jgi:solute carrier family 35 protein F5